MKSLFVPVPPSSYTVFFGFASNDHSNSPVSGTNPRSQPSPPGKITCLTPLISP